MTSSQSRVLSPLRSLRKERSGLSTLGLRRWVHDNPSHKLVLEGVRWRICFPMSHMNWSKQSLKVPHVSKRSIFRLFIYSTNVLFLPSLYTETALNLGSFEPHSDMKNPGAWGNATASPGQRFLHNPPGNIPSPLGKVLKQWHWLPCKCYNNNNIKPAHEVLVLILKWTDSPESWLLA